MQPAPMSFTSLPSALAVKTCEFWSVSPITDRQLSKAIRLPLVSRRLSGILRIMPPEKITRRLKTYAGAQGFVYQYYFVGQRAALADDPEAPATEFVFDVTSDRKLTYAVSVFLRESAVTEWAAKHGRPLTEPERYAAAKLRLFRAFDELTEVKAEGRRLVIDSDLLTESLATLGVV